MTGCKFGYTCFAILGTTVCGCAHEALDEYAVEHNLMGQRLCSLSEPMVSAREAASRGCLGGEIHDLKEESDVNVPGQEKEEAL